MRGEYEKVYKGSVIADENMRDIKSWFVIVKVNVGTKGNQKAFAVRFKEPPLYYKIIYEERRDEQIFIMDIAPFCSSYMIHVLLTLIFSFADQFTTGSTRKNNSDANSRNKNLEMKRK